MNPLRSLMGVAAACALAGCASFSADGGFGRVEQLVQDRGAPRPAYQRSEAPSDAAQARVAALLAQPLTADGAVELSLLQQPGLQARLAELGVAEADRVSAGRPSNPRLGFGRLRGDGSSEIDRSLTVDLLGLLTLPLVKRIEQGHFEQAQLQLAHDVLQQAADTRKAYFQAVAAQALARYAEQVHDAAEASHQLAQRMRAAGNFNALAQLREQAFYLDAQAQLQRARRQAVVERERLVRALGLGEQAARLTLPEQLPGLPEQARAVQDAEQQAMDQRLDVRLARRGTEAMAQSLGLTRTTRFVNVLDLGYQNQSSTGEPRRNGYTVELELPLFDFGSARSARAEARYLQSLHHTAQVAVNARSEVREAHAAYLSAYQLARHYRDEVVPLHQRISEENLLRYNGMLGSVFDLLADAREQIASVTASVEALRDHWLADTDLQTALSTGSPAAAR